MTRRKPAPKRKPVTLTAAEREGVEVRVEVVPKLSPLELLLRACSEWDARFVAARVAGIPMPESDCEESQRVRALLKVEMRARARAREGK